jgi:hypothetical protein
MIEITDEEILDATWEVWTKEDAIESVRELITRAVDETLEKIAVDVENIRQGESGYISNEMAARWIRSGKVKP